MRNRRRRNRHRNRRPQFYRRSMLILLLTAIYMVLYVMPVFVSHYQAAEASQGELFSQGFFDAVTAFIQIFCLFFALTVMRILWVLIWPLLCIFTVINDYMFSVFHTQVSKYAIAVFFEPKAREAESLLTPGLIIMLIGGACFAILGLYMLSREKKDPRNRRPAIVAMLLAIGLVTINQGGMSTPYPPYNFLTSAYQYGYERFGMLPSDRADISLHEASYTPAGEDPLVVVVVLGESARGDHFSINGYERETTPLLEKRENLVNFKDTLACGVWTRVAVPCIMTRASLGDQSLMYAETSFISMFRKLGFQTAWLSTQGKLSVYYPVTPITYDAEEQVMLEEQQVLDNTIKDEQLLPVVEERLKNQTRPLLLVLHTYGSHWQYSARYPKAFERYTPTCGVTLSRKYDTNEQLAEIRDCYTDPQALTNSYDNTILYTDYVLDGIIKLLEHKNALFVFTADHGESLGEKGRFLHGHNDRTENHLVPMFWWASDSYIAANPERWQVMVQKSATPTNHDVIFHSVLDCSGIASDVIDKNLSLCYSATPLEDPKPLEAIPPAEDTDTESDDAADETTSPEEAGEASETDMEEQ